MASKISDPASCEVRSVIRFINAKGVNAAQIHRELIEVYGPGVMDEGKVRQWCRQFKSRIQTFTTKSEVEDPVFRQMISSNKWMKKSGLIDASRSAVLPKNFPTFLELPCSELSRKSWVITKFVPDGCRKFWPKWCNSQAADFYAEGVRKLVPRYTKCPELNGDYVGK